MEPGIGDAGRGVATLRYVLGGGSGTDARSVGGVAGLAPRATEGTGVDTGNG
jgi:hypothetical protein